jgi:hypothetical protein
MKEHRILVCLWGQMRGPRNCLPTLYQNVINPWGADVAACINKFYDDDEKRIETLSYLGANIIDLSISQQEDPTQFFPQSFYKKLLPLAQEKINNRSSGSFDHLAAYNFNYLAPLAGSHSSLIIRLNWLRLSYMVERHINDYDYFVISRPDHLYLFPVFPKEFLKEDEIIHYDEHGWGGINADFIVIHKCSVIDWLRKSIQYLIDETLQDQLLEKLAKTDKWNSERYTMLVSEMCNWKMKEMSINSFISADSLEEKSSSNRILCDGKYYYKYESNYIPCKKNFELWENGWRWQNTESKIKLNEP